MSFTIILLCIIIMRTRRWAFLMCLFVDYIHYDVGGMLASANYMSCNMHANSSHSNVESQSSG